MKKEIKASVVVCAFNEEKRLAKCLDSIKVQIKGVDGIELLIVDNDSVDNTALIAKEFVSSNALDINVRYIRIKHVDLTISRNTGVKQTNGEFIVFIDADAYADKSWLAELLSGFETDVDIVSGRVENLNHESYFSNFIYNSHFKASVFGRNSKLIGANMAIRRTVFDAVGGFMDQVKGRGDEVSLATKYFTLFPEKKQQHVNSAVVYNEHPERLKVWLKQQYNEGKSYMAILRLTDNLKFRENLKNVMRFMNLAFWVGVLPSFYIGNIEILIVLFGCMIIRNGFRIKYISSALYYTKNNIGFFESLLVIPNALLGTLVLDFGCIKELVFGEKLVSKNARMITSQIIDEC